LHDETAVLVVAVAGIAEVVDVPVVAVTTDYSRWGGV
jgi:hypothetical protein